MTWTLTLGPDSLMAGSLTGMNDAVDTYWRTKYWTYEHPHQICWTTSESVQCKPYQVDARHLTIGRRIYSKRGE